MFFVLLLFVILPDCALQKGNFNNQKITTIKNTKPLENRQMVENGEELGMNVMVSL